MSEALTEQEIADLVRQQPHARDVWAAGYEAGYAAGMAAAQLSQEEQAALAATKFYNMEAHQEWLQAFVPQTVSAMEVERYRRQPGSSYIPRKGDHRYACREAAQ